MNWLRPILIIVFFLFCSTVVIEGCSSNEECKEGDKYSTLEVNPNQSKCTKHCDCNNQKFEGYCIKGFCSSYSRDACKDPGKEGTCQPQSQFSSELPQNCKTWIRICQEGGLNSLVYGNCFCKDQATEATPAETTPADAGTTEKTGSEKRQCPKPAPSGLTCKSGKDCCHGFPCKGIAALRRCGCRDDNDCFSGTKCCSPPVASKLTGKVCLKECPAP